MKRFVLGYIKQFEDESSTPEPEPEQLMRCEVSAAELEEREQASLTSFAEVNCLSVPLIRVAT